MLRPSKAKAGCVRVNSHIFNPITKSNLDHGLEYAVKVQNRKLIPFGQHRQSMGLVKSVVDVGLRCVAQLVSFLLNSHPQTKHTTMRMCLCMSASSAPQLIISRSMSSFLTLGS